MKKKKKKKKIQRIVFFSEITASEWAVLNCL